MAIAAIIFGAGVLVGSISTGDSADGRLARISERIDELDETIESQARTLTDGIGDAEGSVRDGLDTISRIERAIGEALVIVEATDSAIRDIQAIVNGADPAPGD